MTTDSPTRVLIVDDQEMIRVGLRTILSAQPDLEVVDALSDGLQAVAYLDVHQIDVVLMDVRMPGIDGVEATRRIRLKQLADRVRIIMLTTFEHDELVVGALRAGANGFLSKAVGPDELVAQIHEVVAGGGALSSAAALVLIGHVADQPTVIIDTNLADRFTALTPRERDVVVAAAAGLDNAQIAAQMFVSPFTVKTHANRAMNKIGARDRAQLVAFAYRAGLVS